MVDRVQHFLEAVNKGATDTRWYTNTLVRLVRAAGLVVAVFVVGTLGYYLLSGGEHGLLKCTYMTVITLTTVGYGEIIPIQDSATMKVFTITLIVVGMGGVLYFASALTAFIVDGELRNLIRIRRMAQKIDKLENHFLVTGIGSTGEYVLREIVRSDRDCVVIDHSRDRIETVQDELDTDFPYICGDATDDSILMEAGVDRAMALICSLGNDRDNLFVTISARSINPNLRIVTRGSQPESEQKFKMAGADSVIYTNVLGGMRMAAEGIRPEVTTFLDLMVQDHGHYRRVEELPLPDDSPLIGKTIRDTPIRKHTDALIIAVYDCTTDEYVFNPGPGYVLTEETKLIVLTLVEDIETIERLIRGDSLER